MSAYSSLRVLPSVLVSLAFLHGAYVKAADLLMAGFIADKVIRYNGTTGALVGVFAEHLTLMDGPTALVYDPAGNLLVLNEFSHNVLKFDGSGAFISELIPSSALGSVGLGDPADMELGLDGNLYLMSHGSISTATIWKFDISTGAFLGNFATTGTGAHTHGLVLGPDGNFYQGNLVTGAIDKFNGTTGAFLGAFASHPDLTVAADLAFSPDGATLYVTRDGTGGTMRFSGLTGTFIDYLAPAGASASMWGILADSGSLYVGNKSTGTVKKYDANSGAFISDFITGPNPGPFDFTPMVVPEPESTALLLIGVGLIGALMSHRRRRARPQLAA